ncbi:cobalamin-binding protein [soil metagenome]
MRIVSLLPSGTEIAFALGLGNELAGRTFECDHPAAAEAVPVVSGTALPTDGSLSAAEIDAEVSARVAAGESISTLDAEAISAIDPEVILTQDLCRVCAVPSGMVTEALDALGCAAEVVSLDPARLVDVVADIGRIGQATGRENEAARLMASLADRLGAVSAAVAGHPRRRVLLLEWGDPPFNAGHWMPDMVTTAGGEPVLAPVGVRSHRLAWDEVGSEEVDVVVFAPCGFGTDAAAEQGRALLDQPELAGVAEIWAVHADGYFSRPGPRVVDGTELLAAVLHPDVVATAPDRALAVRLR